MNVEPALKTDSQFPQASEPGVCSLDVPVVPAQTQFSSLKNLARQRATGLAMAFQCDQGGPAAAARSADPEPACQAPQAMLL
jgi:hypothetical protein